MRHYDRCARDRRLVLFRNDGDVTGGIRIRIAVESADSDEDQRRGLVEDARGQCGLIASLTRRIDISTMY